jgi:transposase-like protein
MRDGAVITVEDWAEIRRLYLAERMPIKAIAKKLGLARNTVRHAVRSVQPPRYVRAGSGSIVDEVEPRIQPGAVPRRTTEPSRCATH